MTEDVDAGGEYVFGRGSGADARRSVEGLVGPVDVEARWMVEFDGGRARWVPVSLGWVEELVSGWLVTGTACVGGQEYLLEAVVPVEGLVVLRLKPVGWDPAVRRGPV